MKSLCLLPLSSCLAALLLPSAASAQSWLNWSTYRDLSVVASPTVVKVLPGPNGDLYVASSTDQSMVLARYQVDGSLVWSRQFPGAATDLAASSSGLYLVGRTSRFTGVGSDITVVRFDPSGNREWFRYAPGADANSGPPRVGVDPSGNALVTGTQASGADKNILLQKLSAAGTLVWSRTYGTAGNLETAGGLAVDSTGASVITGRVGSGATSDAITARYSAAGDFLWAKGYNGLGNGADAGVSVVTDSAGAAYVAMAATTSPGVNGTAVVKYTSAGLVGWSTVVPGLGSAQSIALSSTGSVAVLGGDSSISQGAGRLNMAGEVQWSGPLAGVMYTRPLPYGIAIDETDCIYSTGRNSDTHFVTVKVNAAGAPVWSNVIADAGEFSEGISVAISSFYEVVSAGMVSQQSTGQDVVLIKNDKLQAGGYWSGIKPDYGGSSDVVNGSVTDSAGNTYVVGSGGYLQWMRGALVKFSPTGAVSWSKLFGNLDFNELVAVAMTPAGNIVAAGKSYNLATEHGSSNLRCFNSAGTMLWGLITGDNDEPTAIRTDATGAVYIASLDVSGSLAITKVSPTGAIVWRTVRTNPTGDPDYAGAGMAVDSTGAVYAVGSIQSGAVLDGALFKVSPNGTFAWIRKLGAAEGGQVMDVRLDSMGRPVVVGNVVTAGVGHALARQYDAAGNVLWNRPLDIAGYTETQANQAALDGSGNLYVSGSAVASGNWDMATFKVSPAGALAWSRIYGTPTDREVGTRVLVDGANNAYSAGFAYRPQTSQDYAVIKYDPNGNALWPAAGDVFVNGAALFDGATHTKDIVRGLGLDSKGGVYLAGNSFGPNGTGDLHVVRFGPLDNAQFVSQSVPTTMTAGQTYTASLSFKNTGNTTWTKALNFKLASRNPADTKAFGINRVFLTDGEAIAPGQSKTFKFNVYAPAVAGAYNFQWKMFHDGIGSFGQDSVNVPVNVTVAPYAARYVSQTLPASVKAGATFTYTVTMRNVGSTAWAPADVVLRATPFPGTFGVSAVSLNAGETIVQGQDRLFTITLTAPTTPGTYAVTRWRMYVNGTAVYFGDTSTSKSITVTP